MVPHHGQCTSHLLGVVIVSLGEYSPANQNSVDEYHVSVIGVVEVYP